MQRNGLNSNPELDAVFEVSLQEGTQGLAFSVKFTAYGLSTAIVLLLLTA